MVLPDVIVNGFVSVDGAELPSHLDLGDADHAQRIVKPVDAFLHHVLGRIHGLGDLPLRDTGTPFDDLQHPQVQGFQGSHVLIRGRVDGDIPLPHECDPMPDEPSLDHLVPQQFLPSLL